MPARRARCSSRPGYTWIIHHLLMHDEFMECSVTREPTPTFSLHRYPFVPSRFYFVPRQWLSDVATTGDFDARHLLLAMCDGGQYIKFPESARANDWTRNPDPRVPNVVSHVTYLDTLARLRTRGWLAAARGEADDTEIYRLLAWPDFAGEGVVYVPRAYVLRRWPGWLGKNQWGYRAALLGLFACMTEDSAVNQVPPSGPLAQLTAGARRIVALAHMALPALPTRVQPGLGLSMLADLGLVEEVKAARTARSRVFRFSPDALDTEPGRWPPELIARLCGLDVIQDEAWVRLVQAFLAHNCKPPEDAPAIWATIRRYARHVATPDDARRVLSLLTQSADRPEAGRLLTGARRVLGDFVAAQEAEARWEAGPPFELPLENGYTVPGAGLLPPHAASRVLDTQLLVTYQRANRLSKPTAAELATGLRLYVRQNAGADDQLVHLFLLRPPLSRLDRWAIEAGSVLDASPLHTRLDYGRPFQVAVECASNSSQLTLRCQFRIRRSRRGPHKSHVPGAEGLAR